MKASTELRSFEARRRGKWLKMASNFSFNAISSLNHAVLPRLCHCSPPTR